MDRGADTDPNLDPGPDLDGAWPHPRRARAALLLLMLGMVFSCLDRSIINLLVEPIQADLGLTDTQFGALQSIAFGAFYVVMAIPLGVLADRYQRRLVVAGGIAVFNFFSVMTGFAGNYLQLFAARVGVGFGEASLAPSAFSLISDYFPPRRLGRAMSLFTVSTYIGSSAAFVIGGALFTWFGQRYAAQPEALLGFKPWQATMITIALPALLLSPCFFLLREPRRRGLAPASAPIGLGEAMRELGKRRAALVLLTAGSSMVSIQIQAVSIWLPALFIRVHGWSAGQIGFWLGMLVLGGGVSGSLIGGWLTDRMTARGRPDGPVAVAALSFGVASIFGVIAPLAPSAPLSLLCFVPVFLLMPITFGVVPTALQMITPNRLRARVSAAYLTAINLVGLSLGPILVGMMTDYFFGTPAGVRYSVALIAAGTGPSMVVLMLLARASYRRLREAGADCMTKTEQAG